MKKILTLLLAASLTVGALSACSNSNIEKEGGSSSDTSNVQNEQSNKASITYPVEIENELGVTVIESEPNAIAVFDLGMLDILDTLNFGDRVVAVTHGQSFPDYLADYSGETYVNLGGFKEWDADALSNSNPDLIFAGFRQNKSIDTVTAIAPTIYFAGASSDTSLIDELKKRVNAVAAMFGGEEEASAYLEEINEKIAKIKAYTAENEVTFVVVTTENGAASLGGAGNGTAFLANDLNLISLYEDTGMGGKEGGRGGNTNEDSAGKKDDASANNDVKGGGNSAGGRIADEEEDEEPVDSSEAVAYILEKKPMYVFVFDKDAAEAEDDQPTAQEIIAGTDLKDADNIIYLDDTVWSSASCGLKSTIQQLDTLLDLFGLK